MSAPTLKRHSIQPYISAVSDKDTLVSLKHQRKIWEPGGWCLVATVPIRSTLPWVPLAGPWWRWSLLLRTVRTSCSMINMYKLAGKGTVEMDMRQSAYELPHDQFYRCCTPSWRASGWEDRLKAVRAARYESGIHRPQLGPIGPTIQGLHCTISTVSRSGWLCDDLYSGKESSPGLPSSQNRVQCLSAN
jgi:hypothetical protein